VLVVFLVLASVPIAATLWVLRLSNGLPMSTRLSRLGEMDQATAIFGRLGPIGIHVFKEAAHRGAHRRGVAHLVHALLATEDQRFYEHHRFDPLRTISAAIANIRHRRAAQGGRHDHAAAGAPELPSFPTRRSAGRIQGAAARSADRADVHQAADSRAV